MKSSLFIRGLELSLRLGWPDNERREPQTIQIDIDIVFSSPPKACETDHLDDTFCYAKLSAHLREKIAKESIHLIEHLASKIYSIVKPSLDNEAKVTIRITKHPKIEGLTQGVCFSYGD